LPYIEASACGLPVIASNVTAQRDYLTEDNSFLIEPNGYVEAKLNGNMAQMAKLCRFYEGQMFPDFGRSAIEQTKQAEAKTFEVQKSADTLKEWGMIQQAEAQKFMDKYNNAVKRYHRLKMIAALIAAAVGVLLGLQFMNLVPPPYNLGVPVGAAALFVSLVWFFL
jgi:glycosyltransferase involved in cell wall biosynthesis